MHKKEVIIPKKVTKELAELCGIILGDGHITYNKNNGDYRVEISGDLREDEYFNHISSLIISLFNKNPTIKIKDDELRLYFSSKKIIDKLIDLGLPAGKKKYIARIPNWAIYNKEFGAHFLRGLADTDFCICFKKGERLKHDYPVIKVGLCSKNLIEDIKTLLNKFGITYYYLYMKRKTNFGIFDLYELDINGRENLEKWMKTIGFSNPKHLTKIAIWRRFGYYNPHTIYKERLKMLEQ